MILATSLAAVEGGHGVIECRGRSSEIAELIQAGDAESISSASQVAIKGVNNFVFLRGEETHA